MKYRAEIDGLRALAVVPVRFHVGFEIFSGGFVGVDVFFVISGYLITTILINDLQNKSFHIFHFYERRARRICCFIFSSYRCHITCILHKSFMRVIYFKVFLRDLFAENFLLLVESSNYFELELTKTFVSHLEFSC